MKKAKLMKILSWDKPYADKDGATDSVWVEYLIPTDDLWADGCLEVSANIERWNKEIVRLGKIVGEAYDGEWWEEASMTPVVVDRLKARGYAFSLQIQLWLDKRMSRKEAREIAHKLGLTYRVAY